MSKIPAPVQKLNKKPSAPVKKQISLKFSDSEGSESESDDESQYQSSEIKEKKIEYKTEELGIERMSLHEQILHRPDTYVGTTRRIKSSGKIWVKLSGVEKFVRKEVEVTEAAIRTFMEIMSNAIDNIWRSKQYKIVPKEIHVTVNKDTGMLGVWNDGKPIPFDNFVDKGKQTNEPKPEVIFGSLLTSTNYDDSEKRKTSGRNGYGGKLTNIFSEMFQISLFNPTFKGIYKQTWTNNMFNKTKPEIIKDKKHFPSDKGKTGYTHVEWKPDLKRFGMTCFDDDYISVIEKVIYDYALIASYNGVSLFYNNKKVDIPDLKSYAKLYVQEKENKEKSGKDEADVSDEDSASESEDDSDEEEKDEKEDKAKKAVEEILQLKSTDCEVVLLPKVDPTYKGELMQISFVNGILTKEGGVHVDQWAEAIFRPIVNKINKVKTDKDEKKKDDKKKKKTSKRPVIDISHVKKYFTIFILTEIDNPEFKTQEKNNLAGPPVEVNVRKTDIQKLMKWEFAEDIERNIKLRELAELKDLGKKKRNYTRIEGLDDANYAGDAKHKRDCILCSTEGKSAATYVTKGMTYGIEGKTGHDYIGVYPLRGKFINVRNASNSSLVKNKEVKGIIRALGLEVDVDYTIPENRDKLRYGKFYIVADGDEDGLHIIGLMYNFFDTLFPSLLETGDFFHFLRIPIVKVNTKEGNLVFIFHNEAKKWIEENKPNKNLIRYFKGLGTSNNKDVKEDFGKYPVCVKRDQEGVLLAKQVFHKNEADFRKQWLLDYEEQPKLRNTAPYEIENLEASEFFNTEMILFSMEDCARSIPHVLDGQKQSQRKCLTAAFRRKLNYKKKSLKVAQFAGYVAEHMGYLHGEQNLFDTITKMGQRFSGSNNISLFYPDGQFGSRLEMGTDAAKARYLHTKLDMITRLIFRPEDDEYLEDNMEEGQVVEKKYYLPIIPLLLVNGASGIGTGSSCNVPSYNLITIIEWITTWLDNAGIVKHEGENGMVFYDTPELVPYFRGFKGTVEVDGSKITTYGVLNKVNETTYEVTELPIGRLNMGINKFKERLEKFREDKLIKKSRNISTDNDPHFIITVDKDSMVPTLENLKLKDTLTTSNMVLWNEKGNLMKFKSVEDILEYYCEKRLDLYKVRKVGILKKLREELKWVVNKLKFIKMVFEKQLVIDNKAENIIDQEMDKLGFDRKEKSSSKKKQTKEDDQDEEDEELDQDVDENDEETEEEVKENSTKNFDYLLDMKRRTFNIKSKMYKKLENDKEKLEKKITDTEKTSAEQMWKNDLKELSDTYPKWDKKAIEDDNQNSKQKPKKKPTPVVKK
jgi:DNA topoisomerase-2